MLTQAELQSQFHYDPETGIFTRLKNKHKSNVKLKENWYFYICINNKSYVAHRLVWLYIYGRFPTNMLDHINGIKNDNRLCNLREVTHAQNMQNIIIPRVTNKSGLLGVTYRKDKNKYIGQCTFNKKLHATKYFDTAEEAHEAYLELKRKLHEFCTI